MTLITLSFPIFTISPFLSTSWTQETFPMVPFIRTKPDNFRYGYIPPGEYYKPNFIVNITEYRYMIVMHYRINDIAPYRQFIEEFIHLFDINFGTRHCSYMRLYIHEDGRQTFFLIIRMYNAYINGIHDGLQLYEIGSEPTRFFMVATSLIMVKITGRYWVLTV